MCVLDHSYIVHLLYFIIFIIHSLFYKLSIVSKNPPLFLNLKNLYMCNGSVPESRVCATA